MQTREPHRPQPDVDAPAIRPEAARPARRALRAVRARAARPSTRICSSRRRRKLVCSCEPCAILFSGRQGGRYRRVPRDVESLPEFRLSDDQWEDLHLPINLAFFVESTPAGAGARPLSQPGRRRRIASAARGLAGPRGRRIPRSTELEPDVEALLVNRMKGESEPITARPLTSASSWSA